MVKQTLMVPTEMLIFCQSVHYKAMLLKIKPYRKSRKLPMSN